MGRQLRPEPLTEFKKSPDPRWPGTFLTLVILIPLAAWAWACSGKGGTRAAATRLGPDEAAEAQAEALKAHLGDPHFPTKGPGGQAQLCVGIALTPGGPYPDKVDAPDDPPPTMLAELRHAHPALRAISDCSTSQTEDTIVIAVGWPVARGAEVEVELDRHCWWTCASGYKVRLRRVGRTFGVVAQDADRWAS